MTTIKENEPGIVWCKPWGEGQGDYVRIAVSEFDPEVHTPLDAAGAVEPRKARKAKE